MIRAYNEAYLSDAKRNLALAFDYIINEYGMEPDRAARLFIASGYAELFGKGNPAVISGMTGAELGMAILEKTQQNPNLPPPIPFLDLSPEYWAGWALAEFQWASGRSFRDIFERVAFEEILSMYSVYHEMDVSKFVEEMERRCLKPLEKTRLSICRKNRGFSQSELAEASGVGIKSIQMYEQRLNDIDKAQVHTVYKLARAIGCNVEDILEQPTNIDREDLALSLAGIIPADITLEKARNERLMSK